MTRSQSQFVSFVVLAAAGASAQDCAFFLDPQEPSIQISGRAREVIAIDINHDGFTDMVATGGSSTLDQNAINVLLGDGQGQFPTIVATPIGSRSPSGFGLTIADLDLDGHFDAAVADPEANTVWVFDGNGDGSFRTPPAGYPVGDGPWRVAAGDLNGDEWPDLVATNINDGTASVLLAAGTGTFQSQAVIPAGEVPYEIKLADLNADQRLDAIIGDLGVAGGGVQVLLGNGDGTLEAPVRYDDEWSGNVYDVAIGDIDGDGPLDIVSTTAFSHVWVHRGHGDGTFAAADVLHLPSYGISSYAVAIADLNDDGRPDIALHNRDNDIGPNYSSVGAFINTGEGAFGPMLRYGEVFGPTGLAIDAADFNGDALPDIAITGVPYFLVPFMNGSGGLVAIDAAPESLKVAEGLPAVFGVVASGPNLTYRWRRNGQDLADGGNIDGANSQVLVLNGVTPADEGVYECVVSNTCNSQTVSAFLAVGCGGSECPADFNGDGALNIFDFLAFQTGFANGCP